MRRDSEAGGGSSGHRPTLPLDRLRALAEEAAVHAQVAVCLAGLDELGEEIDSIVEPPPPGSDARGLRIVLRDEAGEALDAGIVVHPDGLVRASAAGEAGLIALHGPLRAKGEMEELASDLARLLRAETAASWPM